MYACGEGQGPGERHRTMSIARCLAMGDSYFFQEDPMIATRLTTGIISPPPRATPAKEHVRKHVVVEAQVGSRGPMQTPAA